MAALQCRCLSHERSERPEHGGARSPTEPEMQVAMGMVDVTEVLRVDNMISADGVLSPTGRLVVS
jgi:hypothetical protein